MPKFVSAHIIACMTRQDVERLAKRFIAEESNGIKSLKVQCDTVLGRMVCEWESPDRDTLVEWLKGCHVHIRGDDEWIMRVQLETVDNEIARL